MSRFLGRSLPRIAVFSAVGWGIFGRAPIACAAALFAQAEELPAPLEPLSGTDFIIPGIVVVFLFGVSIFAVCRSSRRV